jgi:hypothetical protein
MDFITRVKGFSTNTTNLTRKAEALWTHLVMALQVGDYKERSRNRGDIKFKRRQGEEAIRRMNAAFPALRAASSLPEPPSLNDYVPEFLAGAHDDVISRRRDHRAKHDP